jgi:hypothetical protein
MVALKLAKLLSIGFLFWIANGASRIKFYYNRVVVLKREPNSIENPRVQDQIGAWKRIDMLFN